MRRDLGFVDLERKTPQPFDNPFAPRSSPMSQARPVTHVSGLDKLFVVSAVGLEPTTP